MVTVDKQTTVDMPDHYKSPLATGFTYYEPKDVTKSGSAIQLYTNTNTNTKGYYYTINGDATPVSPTTAIEGTVEYYVVYTYNTSNTIAKLDGSVNYNIHTKGRSKTQNPYTNKGFFALNRGRNNRPAILPTDNVDPQMLSSEDFVEASVDGSGVSAYWDKPAENKNKREDVESQFFFGFKFEGKDPYHIVIRTSYPQNTTYIEQNNNITPTQFVYKWHKEGSLFAVGTASAYIASDEHIRYNIEYDPSTYPTNPTELTKGDGTGYIDREGNWHGQKNAIWSTVALLNNYDNSGYVFMGTRTVDGNGKTPDAPYYLKEANNYNNLVFNKVTNENASNNLSIEGIYPLKKVTFKVVTPFYKVSPTTDHIVSAPTEWVSQYTVDNEDIDTKYLPTSLLRKYCTYTNKFYSDAACTQEITRFSGANYDPTEGYQVYIGYEVSSAKIPFKAITPAASYTDDTWKAATWYELTDEGSTQTDGLKLKYDGTNFKNNGADNAYDKYSEFAFIGDPYELRVVLRNNTADNTVQYVGATGTPPSTGTALTVSTTASEGYKWELPNDATAGSFLLRKYKDEGNWYWDAGHPSPVAISYSTKTHTYNVATANAQTVIFNVSDLGYTEGDYILVTAGGTDASQVTVTSEHIHVQDGGTASFTAAIKGRGDSNKTFTLTIQKYNSSNVAQGTASVVTVNQNNSDIVANTVSYSTSNSTRVKVMTLPTRSFTYNIVDKSGRIAVKATTTQTIFSPLSLASIPSIIVSPFLVGETITFYSTFNNGSGAGTGTSRTHLDNEITALTEGNAASSTNIYVKYTTSALNAKAINLSEDQELNVKLNGQYIYYDKEANALKTNASPTTEELDTSEYLWKLRNRDPYAMLIDNMGAREDLDVNGQPETPDIYDDNGTKTNPSRQKGAWLKLSASLGDAVGFTFVTDRANAQQFIAKSSLQTSVYEVMVADGGSVDASTTYYDIGCPSENTVKIYNNMTYAHGGDELRFVLNQNVPYTYHLIDKAKHELLTATSKTPDLALPAEYQSPLVGTYHFYASDQITKDTSKTPNEYTPTDPANKYITDFAGLNATWDTDYPASSNSTDWGNAVDPYKLTATDDTHMLAQARLLTTTGTYHFNINNGASYKKINVTRAYQGTDIYVTYDANDVVTFNTAQYMLKFLQPDADGYHLEDGNDKLTSDKIQAVYPYCNGDGNLNIYGAPMQEEQFNGGSSTRPRWVWYFVSANSDPYHVRIRSKSTISYKSINNPTYLTTYAVHFNQDTAQPKKQRIVTGGTLPGVASATPMEYMVLGSAGNYKLLTTERVAADLNGDGDTEDTVDGVSENARRNVTSFEQYWKTYNMVKLHVLGISKTTDEYSDDPATWVVPNTPLETTYDASSRYKVYNDAHDPDLNYRDFLYQQMGWHSYDAYANATRWNGYNDKTNGGGKKVVEKIEHWYQTFDMGTGTFDIESADIPPVLVLLDRHGWEIMRRPIPTKNYPEGEELKGLRVYDSPLVDRYYFYSNATKASGCHKYTLRLNDDETERDQIKVNGVHYSSTSLGDLPPITATGVKSSDAFNDQFVVYTVKEEYENNYSPSLDKTTSPYTESGISQPYLVLQNGRFYKAENTLAGNHDPSYLSKPISEHTDPEGGNVYDLIVSPHNHGGTNNNIIDGSGNFLGNNFWYVKPNLNIDDEMGIPWVQATGEANETAAKNKLRLEYNEKNKSGFDPYNIQLQLVKNNSGADDGRYLTTQMTSAYLDDGVMVGEYSLTAADAADVDVQAKKLRAIGKYYFKQNDAENYWLVNVTTAYNGSTDATYTGPTLGSYATEWSTSQSTNLMITLAAAGSATVTSEGYDHTTLQISNQTFMAVSDVNGNMQLMPRFDHTQRVDLENVTPWVTHLSDSKDHAKASVDNNSSMGAQTTFFVTPKRFQYHIIDNNGREALRYKRGADFYPTITNHFKSPLAKDFTYYKGLAEGSIDDSNAGEWNSASKDFQRSLTKLSMLEDAVNLLPQEGVYYYRIGTRGAFTYKKVTVAEGKGLTEQQITGSFAAAELSDVDNNVYVRYSYDEDADHDGDNILLGKWFTVKLANKDLQAQGTVVIQDNPGTGDVEVPGTGVNLYAGEASRSLIAADKDDVDTQAKKLTETGDFYFKEKDAENYWLVNVTVAYNGSTDATYTGPTPGSYATEWSNSKPLVVEADAPKWQWKFLSAPTDPSSDYYVEPDPYAIQLFNRYSNYTINPSAEPSPMSVGIKVPNDDDGADRFALLSHPNGGYAFVVAKTYEDCDYPFLNGADMTDPDDGSPEAATTATEKDFNYKTGIISDGAKVVLDNDVTHHYTYYVITNGNKLAITATQNKEEAESNVYAPSVPESAQSPLLNMDDYLYYGFAAHPGGDTYSVIPQTILYTLFGLYDDNVYVRYKAYDMDKTSFKVPNKRNATDSDPATTVARDPRSVDVSMNISGGLPYNIVWYNDNMMQSTDDATVSDGGSHSLSGDDDFIWYFTENDPYALKIRHKSGKYLSGTDNNLVAEVSAPTFMMLRKSGYDYGILQKTGDDDRLSGHGETTTTGDPTKFIIFGLSIHNLIYHLVIAKSCPNQSADPLPTDQYVDIPYRETISGTLGTKRIYGTTQRDLTSIADPTPEDLSPIEGSKYQLGKTLSWNGEAHTYSYDAGSVSIGDDLVLPTVFYRPNCLFDFYVEGIYNGDGAVITAMENKYKGLQLTGENPKLMSDEELIDQTVVVNVVYKFNPGLETNAGGDFVTEMKAAGTHYLWYTFETADATPQLAHYTYVRGMRAESGRALHYTNDYLWSPLGDPYGFKSYNRYIYKNNAGTTKVLTSTALSNNQPVVMETPGENSCTSGNEIYELLPSSTPESGNFRVHPLLNTDNTLFLRINESVDPAENGKLILSNATPVQEWTYGLSTELLNPYYQGAGNVGGLNATGKTAYENAQTEHASDPFQLITELQKICYNNTNIVPYSAGYYRLCNQTGASSLSTQRYASGYLHEIEKTAGTSDTPIPMHFYSKKGVTGSFAGDTNPLTSGFTETAATRGEIPIPATEYDPSTIFQFTGTKDAATMQTQGLYVKGVYIDEHSGNAKMTSDSEDATSFHVDDIGGAVVNIYNLDGSTRRYINYGQNASIYDLKYYENVDVDGSKWCMEPASTQNLKVATNNGGDGYYYATFYAPFDVQLPADADGKTYNAYTCKTWENAGLHPTAVPATTISETNYAEGKFVPAGTPVILRVKDESGSVTLTLPTASPRLTPITTDLKGKYLEQLLALDAAHDVYTMGVPFSSSVDKDTDYDTTGDIIAPLPEFETSGVGFYINATYDKESDPLQSLWQRNNRYVLHNKIYYRATGGGGGSREMRGIEFVPVIFDDDLEDEEQPGEEQQNPSEGATFQGDGCIYDMMGRKVATRQQVEDGSWRLLRPGIYILNGKKFRH